MKRWPYGLADRTVPHLTENEARLIVEAHHGRRLGETPVARALVFGWGSCAVLSLLNFTDMAHISEWVGPGVGVAVGLGFYWQGRAKQKEMRADVERLLGRYPSRACASSGSQPLA